ncbi:MAG TPA: hypothetical protein PK268_07390 [Enterococcus sp.]|nr:hypothetical protein [Enterococcus sp.]HPR81688.1 hypothetical protein [Enterococcus sp.]
MQPEQLTDIGHLLLGQVAGLQSVEKITVFDSTGIALQDLAVTKQILDTAAEKISDKSSNYKPKLAIF